MAKSQNDQNAIVVETTRNALVPAQLGEIAQGVDIRIDSAALVAAYKSDHRAAIQRNIRAAIKDEKAAAAAVAAANAAFTDAANALLPDAKHTALANKAAEALKEFYPDAMIESAPRGSKSDVKFSVSIETASRQYSVTLFLAYSSKTEAMRLTQVSAFSRELNRLADAVDAQTKAQAKTQARLRDLRDLLSRIDESAEDFAGALARAQLNNLPGGSAYAAELDRAAKKIQKSYGLKTAEELGDLDEG